MQAFNIHNDEWNISASSTEWHPSAAGWRSETSVDAPEQKVAKQLPAKALACKSKVLISTYTQRSEY